MKLQITEYKSVDVSSVAELSEYFTQILKGSSVDRPTIVTVEEAHGHSVTVGIHPKCGWVQIAPVSGLPPYMVTIGNDPRDDVRVYYLQESHHTEVPLRYEVPIADAIEAAVTFVETGTFLHYLKWDEI
jgi:hypothetical protein